MIHAGIVGATGYAGSELVRLLLSHPEAEVTAISSVSFEGMALSQVYPAYNQMIDLVCGTQDQVVEAAIAAVKAGAVESELAAYVEGLYRQHGADRSGEGQLVCFGPNGADPHYAPNGTVLRDGDSVVLDIFIPIRRYWCDMTRTVFFRSVSDEGRRVYETVKAAIEPMCTSVEALTTGTAFAD